ncbi:MAG: flagellar biosynthesis protein FliQ [Chromatiaceae bacterium]|nr:flagellar biosynthesis protein FliQ [Gammaproteobacteria bacterium]MCP5305697.1 flagellar biosynthesis protein FliQ [Chromatiaceae bacterium]MCP5312554.1 flagellar biosynthesis protein FliQ [Chromatiaceae bacterium]
MDADTVVGLGRQAMEITILLAAPILLSSLVVGLIIAMFQAATQINEMTLTFVPKLMTIAVVLMTAGPWMLRQITGFMRQLVENIPYLIG